MDHCTHTEVVPQNRGVLSHETDVALECGQMLPIVIWPAGLNKIDASRCHCSEKITGLSVA